jgi:pSer/pThr/pTyr-binding forkhead associated (FHA) protein
MSELVFVEQTPNQGTEHRVESGTTIGREGCDITLGDPDVSRRHATIRAEGDSVTIEDLGSTNGTFVNGERIDQPRPLRDGDEVQIGAVVWRLRAPAGVTRLAQAQSTRLQPQQATALRPTGVEPPGPAEPPTAEGPPAAAPPPAAEPPPAATPPAAAPAAAAAGPGGQRGDVPAPDFQPSKIRRVVPPPDTPTPFAPSGQRRRKGSAATRVGATLFAGLVIALTTAGVIVYYVTEPFK